MVSYEQAFIYASGMYLTDRIPQGYEYWDETKLIQYIADHSVDIFETLEPYTVFEEIEQAADHWMRFIKENCNG